MDREGVDATVQAWERAADAMAALPYQTLSGRELAAIAVRRERVARRHHATDHTVLAALSHNATYDDFGAATVRDVLVELLHLSPDGARQRLTDAAQLGPRYTLTGETLPPEMADTAAALARGDISLDHIRQIQDFLTNLPSWVDPQTYTDTEHTLARIAVGLGPDQLRQAAGQLLDYIDPDGAEPDYEEQSAT